MKAFNCKRCGACCYGELGIALQPEERFRIADFLSTTPTAFAADFCLERNSRLYLKTGSDDCCIFHHQEKQCLIHSVKPQACSMWPYYPALWRDEENWRTTQDVCLGINRECTFEEFVLQAKKESTTKHPDNADATELAGTDEPSEKFH